MSEHKTKVRIAPSPTGFLHIGTARTALFNLLYARSQAGEFVLRIEDTDKTRSTKKYEKNIVDNLKWLGINWDNEKIPHQSKRNKIYSQYLEKLLVDGNAYYCNCSKDRLEKLHNEQKLAKLPPRYDGLCKDKKISKQDNWQTIRLNTARLTEKTPIIFFDDKIRGKIATNKEILDDFVIANKSGALYNLTVVIDDHLFGITHVIRGEDHISNTPKQILIYQALQLKPPKFAHIPLILNPDKSKMSKRSGDTQVADYREKGYLPEALINFLSLLGWHPNSNQEILSLDETIKLFSLNKVQKSGAIFDIDKLNWMNSQYIKELSSKDYLEKASQFIPEKNLKLALLFKDRLNYFAELSELTNGIKNIPDYTTDMLNWKDTDSQKTTQGLELVLDILKNLEDFSTDNIEKKLKQAITDNNLSGGEVLWPLRVALSGQEKSPPPFDIAEAIGKKETLVRINTALKQLQ